MFDTHPVPDTANRAAYIGVRHTAVSMYKPDYRSSHSIGYAVDPIGPRLCHRPQQRLYFFLLPQGHGSLRPVPGYFVSVLVRGADDAGERAVAPLTRISGNIS